MTWLGDRRTRRHLRNQAAVRRALLKLARIVDPNYCGKLHGLLAVAVVRMAQQTGGAS